MAKKQTFADLYKSASTEEQNRINTEITKRCNVAISTIVSWAYGSRNPKKGSRIILSEMFNAPASTLFPPRQ